MSFQSLKRGLTSAWHRGAVKQQLGFLLVGLGVVLLAAGQLAHAKAGPSANDIQDSGPMWNPDGVHVAFERTAPSLQHVLAMTSAGKDTYVVSGTGVLRGYLGPKFLIQSGSDTSISAGGRFAGPPIVVHGTYASASPDGGRLAYVRGNDLYVAAADGSGERLVSHGVAVPSAEAVGPAWSPDGRRIVVASAGGLVLAAADGSSSRVLVSGNDLDPTWSRDGATVAYQQHDEPYDQIWAVGADGTNIRRLAGGAADYRFPQYSPVSGVLAFISDRQHLIGGATPYQYALYTRDPTGIDHKLVDDVHPDSPPRWSPTAALIAVSAGQECFRWGIYTVRSEGGNGTRRSNIGRFTGTTADDRLGGSYYFDRIRGLGGNDLLEAFDGNDVIEGGNGNDVVLAGAGNDVVFGGPGDDRIFGGAGDDTIIPGNGRDRIDCGPGNDTVEGSGPLDRIAKNCEHVRR